MLTSRAVMTEPPALIPRAMRGILSLEDLEPVAERFLPNCLFQFVSGGGRDQYVAAREPRRLSGLRFLSAAYWSTSRRARPRQRCSAKPVAHRSASHRWAARACPAFAPTSLRAGRALRECPFILSGASLIRMEEIAQANPQAWFQAYLPTERDGHRSLARSRRGAGYRHACRHRRCAGQRQSREPGACRLFLAASPELPARLRRRSAIRAGCSAPRYARCASRHALLREHRRERGTAVFSRDATRAHLRDALVLARHRMDPRALAGQAL